MICAYCRLPIESVKYKTHKRKSYHIECFELLLHDAEVSNTEKQTKQNSSEMRALEQYVKNLFGLNQLTYLLQEQISQYTSKNGWAPSTVQKVLDYFYRIEGNEPNKEKPSIGIVPYVFDEAKAFYKSLFDLQQEAQGRVIEQRTKTVRFIPPDTSLKIKTNIENL